MYIYIRIYIYMYIYIYICIYIYTSPLLLLNPLLVIVLLGGDYTSQNIGRSITPSPWDQPTSSLGSRSTWTCWRVQRKRKLKLRMEIFGIGIGWRSLESKGYFVYQKWSLYVTMKSKIHKKKIRPASLLKNLRLSLHFNHFNGIRPCVKIHELKRSLTIRNSYRHASFSFISSTSTHPKLWELVWPRQPRKQMKRKVKWMTRSTSGYGEKERGWKPGGSRGWTWVEPRQIVFGMKVGR